jgi:hypothetical protein
MLNSTCEVVANASHDVSVRLLRLSFQLDYFLNNFRRLVTEDCIERSHSEAILWPTSRRQGELTELSEPAEMPLLL